MASQTICDRCGKVIASPGNVTATEQMKQDYPNLDICEECDIEIQLAAKVAEKAALKKQGQKEILEKWIALYESH